MFAVNTGNEIQPSITKSLFHKPIQGMPSLANQDFMVWCHKGFECDKSFVESKLNRLATGNGGSPEGF